MLFRLSERRLGATQNDEFPDELDLSSKIPTKPEVVEAMRLRIIQARRVHDPTTRFPTYLRLVDVFTARR